MNLIKDIYKTSNLATYGKFISIFVIFLLVCGPFLIPEFIPKSIRQLITLNGKHLKYDDKNLTSDFFNSIKNNNGILCLGTSESGSIKESGNYFNFLNDDPDLESRFSILGGAGRTCGKYIPIFLNHKNDVKSLKVIYFINPVYWRDDLSNFSNEYWNRYISYSVANNITQTEQVSYYKSINPYLNNLNTGQKLVFESEYWLRKLRTSYFQDLNYILNPENYYNDQSYVSKKNDLTIYKNFGIIDYSKFDTILNITKEHSVTHLYQPINNMSTYRTDELLSFIKLCKELEIDITYVLGPINRKFIRAKFPNDLNHYDSTVNDIKKVLDSNNVKYINTSSISNESGTFIDPLHHSSFGAYLIYLEIKKYILNEI